MFHQLKVTLEGVVPPIWRRVVVPSEFTLYELHHVIQVAMGWEDCHLHDFAIKRQRYAVPGAEVIDGSLDETVTTLQTVARARSKMRYVYDFGDEWNHVIVVEKILKSSEADDPGLPICIDGARAGPPEDAGGAWGYELKLQALRNPDDEDSVELREWIGADFDPERFDLELVNRELQELFRPPPRRKRRPRASN